MEGMNGMILLQKIQKYNSILPVIMLSDSAHISDVVRATHQGVFKFKKKPVLYRCNYFTKYTARGHNLNFYVGQKGQPRCPPSSL